MKIQQFLGTILFLAAAVSAPAGEVLPKLLDYENVEILKVLPDGLKISHRNGITKVPLEDLPDEIRRKYSLKQESAEEFRRDKEQEKTGREEEARILEILRDEHAAVEGMILQVLKDGVLIKDAVFTFGKKVEMKRKVAAGTKFGTGPTGLHPNRRGVQQYSVESKWVQPKAQEPGPVFIACDTRGIAERTLFRAIVFSAGSFEYESVSGASRNVMRFTVDPNRFVEEAGFPPLKASALAQIEALHPGYPKIPVSLFNSERSPAASAGSTGSGAAIGDGSLVVTCEHVVGDAKTVKVRTEDSRLLEAEVFIVNKPLDLAVLKLKNGERLPAVKINTAGCEMGDQVFTLGFPNPDMQGVEAKFTDGRVSSNTGLRDDRRSMQITVPLQPGNSGGALLNMRGEMVGVVTSSLSAAAALRRSGALPENVNFAAKADFLESLLPETEKRPAHFSTSRFNQSSAVLGPVIKSVRPAVVQVICGQ